MSQPLPAGWAPDLIEPVIGFRQWLLVRGMLRSLHVGTPWPSALHRARCAVGRHHPTEAPAKECVCGIYAYYDPCPRTASALTADFLGGAVVTWGRIEAHPTGYRARHARVIALELPLSRGPKRRAVLDAAERLGVAAVAHRALRELALDHGSPLPRSLRPAPTHGAAVNVWNHVHERGL
jgi:hypothetical protein